ncbi:MAG TPA: ABC-F family ATP-binding cassette domain-containing protein, partial [Herpetosiphonaceae bacterium]|nr:ABC-F family ATP-binding cassette domain-containing protein [Herpetosiphonaceae bacterium]
MNLVAVESVAKQFDEKPLFTDVTFGIEAGERVGVIGVNGSGKSTLLRIVAGVEPPDAGRIVTRSAATIAYLPQNPPMDPEQTVLDYLFASDDPRMHLIRDYEAVVAGLHDDPTVPNLLSRLDALSEQIEAAGGWDAERQAREILTRLGIADVAQQLGSLSGGQRRRVALAAALMQPADLLILDEPTNHIDADTVAWLEQFLGRTSAAVLLVTHDRYFLDRLVSRIVEVDHGQVRFYVGGYFQFLTAKAEQAEIQRADAGRYKSILRKELAWLQRGARARSTKQKARIERIEELQDQAPERAQEELAFTVRSPQRLGKRVLEAKGVTKTFDARVVLRDASLTLGRGDRLGLVGPNGSGKTTLLNLLSGRIQPDSGAILQGDTVRLAYYDQESAGLDDRLRGIDYLAEAAPLVQSANGALITAGAMLERFLFPPAAQWTRIASLSGGERRRLYLLRTLIFGPNVLLLDEPTNDLDIQTLSILEDYLDDFDGTLVIASHDRYFLDRTVNQIVALDGTGALESYAGGYTAYVEERKRREAARQAARPKPSAPAPAQRPKAERPRTLTFKEQRELADLETRIAALEAQQRHLNSAIADAAGDYEELRRHSEALAQISVELEAAVERWAELSTIAINSE